MEVRGDGDIELSHDVHFSSNKWKILPTSYSVLDDLVESLRAQPAVRVRVWGHPDGRGSEAINLTLSRQRALATMLIDAARVDDAGLGSSRPIDTTATAPGLANNRRVEVRTLSVIAGTHERN